MKLDFNLFAFIEIICYFNLNLGLFNFLEKRCFVTTKFKESEYVMVKAVIRKLGKNGKMQIGIKSVDLGKVGYDNTNGLSHATLYIKESEHYQMTKLKTHKKS